MPSRPHASKPRIGITGGPGVGKSTVLSFLTEAGYSVVSADEVARPILGQLEPDIADIAGLESPFTAAELRAKLFGAFDESSLMIRRRMNAALHAPILRAMSDSEAAFWEVPLLVEAGLHPYFDEVWVVDCGIEIQRSRLLGRYSDPRLVEGILATHLPSRVKKLFSDHEVRTDQAMENVRFVTLELARDSLARLAQTWE